MIRSAFVAPVCAWLALCATDARAQEQKPASSPPPPATQEPLTLERAVSLAAEQNEGVLSAQARAEAAAARVARARAFFFPRLNTTTTYTRRTQEVIREVGGEQVVLQGLNGLGGTAVARVTLFDARGFPLYQAARRDSEATEQDAVETRRQVGFQAANAFLATLGSQQVADAAQRRLDFARQSLEEAKARAQAGLASTNDVTRVLLEVATAEAQLAESTGQALTSRLELGFLLVTSVEGALAAPEQLLTEASRPVESFLELADKAEERRPDILSAKLRVQAQEASAREPLARLFPSLGASAQFRFTNEPGFGRASDLFFTVDLSWTLFDGGERYAERRERLALARALELDTRARVRRVDVAVERARVALRTSQAALDRSRVAFDAARQNAEETSILYRQGLATSLSLSDALLRQFEAEVALARARYALGSSLLELRAAVGLDPLGKEP
ncbi:TolC family protein [Archangium sp.]|uniref:TolC family protein n=1 Tax=Archangium sp. TaxID=1872627 RepID=UPI00286C2572|nr:TolC family protein [Archangium sp.]